MSTEKTYGIVADLQNGQLSRREFIKRALELGMTLPLAMGILASCGPGETPEAPSPTQAPGTAAPVQAATVAPTQAAGPRYGGRLVVAYPTLTTSIDPNRIKGQGSSLVRWAAYESLIRLKPESGTEFEPALAESWDTSEDSLTWVFHLRKGVKFHDGTPFDAGAVVFTFMRVLDENHPFHTADLTSPKTNFDFIDKVEALDEYTVQMTLKWPFPYVEQMIAHYGGLIVCPATIEKYGEESYKVENGTGPFKLTEWVEGEKLVFTAYEEYWDGRPYLDELVLRTITEASTQLAELEAGGVGLVQGITHPRNLGRIQLNPDLVIHSLEGYLNMALAFNNTKPIFQDERVRHAINYAIDRESLARDVYQGLATPSSSIIPPTSPYYDNSIGLWPYDPEKAKQLLADAGYPDGFEIDLWQPNVMASYNIVGPELGTALQSELGKVGIKVKLIQIESAAYTLLRKDGVPKYPWEEVDTFLHFIGSIVADVDNFLFTTYRTVEQGGRLNYSHYADERTSELITQGRQTADPEERKRIYYEIQQRMNDYAPTAPLYWGKFVFVATKKVKDFVMDPTSTVRWQKVWLEE